MGTIYVGAFGTETRLGEITFAGERVEEPPRVPAPYRVMPDWVVAYVTAGRGTYRFADGRTAPIHPGTVILVPPLVRHWYGTPHGAPWTETFVVFKGPLFELLLTSAGVDTTDGPRRPHPAPSVHTLGAIVRASESTAAEAEHRLLALADWLIDAIGEATRGRPSTAIEQAARRLAADTSAALDMRAVAASLGLSYTTFRRRFVAEVGESPGAYRNRARLDAVAGMLKLTDMTAREIARRFGFTDEFHMSRRFKAAFGVPPSEYRRPH